MAATFRLANLRINKEQMASLALRLVIAGGLFWIARFHGWWVVAAFLIVGVELAEVWKNEGSLSADAVLKRLPALVMGVSVAIVITITPRELSQAVIAAAYGVWRWWWSPKDAGGYIGMVNIMAVETVAFWAIFLMSAQWRTYEWLILALVWAASYGPVLALLRQRGERMAAVLAAAWALVATEISWVLVRWLFVYVTPSGYLMIPQATVVLAAMGYVFGSIYMAQREGKLSRSRLTEYVLIGLILIAVVIMGTPWRGSL